MILDVALAASMALSDQSGAVASLTHAEFETFYRETARPLWAYLARLCGDRALADDLLQESYLRFCRARLPAVRGEWKAYLYRIGTNLAADWWRQAGRRVVVASVSEIGDAADRPDAELAAVRRHELDRALATLKPRDRALLWLAYVEGSDHREIAKTLGLSRASVKVLLFRARRKLAEVLEKRGIGSEVLP